MKTFLITVAIGTVLILAIIGALRALPYQHRLAVRPGPVAELLTVLRIPWRLPEAETERLRSLLYADQSLDEVVFESAAADDERRAIELLRDGHPGDAVSLLTPQVLAAAGPGATLTAALAHHRNEDDAGASALLQSLLSAQVETRWRLWAATGLHELSATIDPAVADELMGVVAETPMELGLDTLAVYQDGSVRYVNQSGHVFLYDRDGRLDSVAGAVGPVAQRVFLTAPLAERGRRSALKKGEFRITFLTPRGPRTVVENRNAFGQGSTYSEVFSALASVLRALVALRT